MAKKPGNTTEEFKARHKDTLGAKDEVMNQLEALEKAERDKKNAADKAARAARQDKFKQESNELWFGGENNKDPLQTVKGKAEAMSKEAGGRGYENYTSAMSQIIEFSILLNKALAKDFRTGSRLVDLAGFLGGVALTVAKKTALTVLNPVETAKQAKESVAWFDRKYGAGWTPGATLSLPESILNAATCDANGKITFSSLKDELPPGTDSGLVTQLETVHQAMVKEFLVSEGYTEATPGSNVFTARDPSVKKLDQNEFNLLVTKKDGLKDAFNKSAMKLTDKPVTYAGGKPVEPPEVKNDPEPKSWFKFR